MFELDTVHCGVIWSVKEVRSICLPGILITCCLARLVASQSKRIESGSKDQSLTDFPPALFAHLCWYFFLFRIPFTSDCPSSSIINMLGAGGRGHMCVCLAFPFPPQYIYMLFFRCLWPRDLLCRPQNVISSKCRCFMDQTMTMELDVAIGGDWPTAGATI